MSSKGKKTAPIAMAVTPEASRNTNSDSRGSDGSVIKDGFLRKMKTNKRKYFVLKSEDEAGPPRLEYYDSYKKWSTGQPPKKAIFLEDCFKICKRIDTKQKSAIGLYLRDQTFSVICDNEDSLQDWLQHLIEAKYRGDDEPNSDQVWDVFLKCKPKEDNGKANLAKNVCGPFRFILRPDSILLVKMVLEPEAWNLEVPAIRGCADGSGQDTFYMEMGHRFALGPCELIFQTEDASVAKQMHQIVANYLKSWKRTNAIEDGHELRDRLNSLAAARSAMRRHTSVSSKYEAAKVRSGSDKKKSLADGPSSSSSSATFTSSTLTSSRSVSVATVVSSATVTAATPIPVASTTPTPTDNDRSRSDTALPTRAPRSRTTSEGAFGRPSAAGMGTGLGFGPHPNAMPMGMGPRAEGLVNPAGGLEGGAIVAGNMMPGAAGTVSATAPAAPSALVGNVSGFGLHPGHRLSALHGSSGACSSYGGNSAARAVFSASPPVTSSPLSPSSGHCSDSAGSSLSVDADYSDMDLVGSAGRHRMHAKNGVVTSSASSAAGMTPSVIYTQILHHQLQLQQLQRLVAGGDIIATPSGLMTTVNAAVISTQPPIIEENPDSASGEYVATTKPTSHDDEYIPFDPEKRVLKRFISTRSPAPPTTPAVLAMYSNAAMTSPTPPDMVQHPLIPLPKSPSPTPTHHQAYSRSQSVVSTPASDYVEMSPVPFMFGSRTPTAPISMTAPPSAAGSVAGSVSKDEHEHYVEMLPQVSRASRNSASESAADDNYLDMSSSTLAKVRGGLTSTSTPTSIHAEEKVWHVPPGALIQHSRMIIDPTREDAESVSVAESVSSIHSGTPSTADTKSGEFRVDKTLYYGQLGDEVLDHDHPDLRPRTQSTGSHIEKGKKMTRTVELQAIAACQRIRAHSMGSQMPKWKKGARRLFDVVGTSLHPPASQQLPASKVSPGSSTTSSSMALHGTSPVSKSWSGPGQYFKLMGASISEKVRRHETTPTPTPSALPQSIQPTEAQLAKDDTLRFFFKKRHSLDHTATAGARGKRQTQIAPSGSGSASDIDYGWLDVNPLRNSAASRLSRYRSPSSIHHEGLSAMDMTPEMALPAPPSLSSSNGKPKLTPSLALCHDWLTNYHGHPGAGAGAGAAVLQENKEGPKPDPTDDDYLPMTGPRLFTEYQQAPNSAPPSASDAPPDWSTPLPISSPSSEYGGKGADYMNMDPAHAGKFSPFVLAAGETAAAKMKHRAKPPLPSFVGVLHGLNSTDTGPAHTEGKENEVPGGGSDGAQTPSSAGDDYLVMVPRVPRMSLASPTTPGYSFVRPRSAGGIATPSKEESERAHLSLSPPRIRSLEEVEEDDELKAVLEGAAPAPSVASGPVMMTIAPLLLRNVVCSPVAEEDLATVSQESMTHIIINNLNDAAEKCEVDATSGTLRVVCQDGGARAVLSGMLKVSSSPLLRSYSSSANSSVLAAGTFGGGGGGVPAPSSSSVRNKCRHLSEPVSLPNAGKSGLFALTREDLLKSLNKPFKKIKGALQPSSNKQTQSSATSSPSSTPSGAWMNGYFPLSGESMGAPAFAALASGGSASVGVDQNRTFDHSQLHYVQLDLPSFPEGGKRSGDSSNRSSPTNPSADMFLSSSSLATVVHSSDTSHVTYAQIDFNKSEGLRNTSMSVHRASK